MVRPSYRANLAGDNGAPVLRRASSILLARGQRDPVDLRGGSRARRRFIDWQTFFDFGDGEVKPNKRIDTKISTPLFNLPLGAIASHDRPLSLPAAQPAALAHLEVAVRAGRCQGGGRHATRSRRSRGAGALWIPILDAALFTTCSRAEQVADGLHLGPVGGRIVAEVLIGLLRETDSNSYLARKPKWTPTLASAGTSFRMKDFLTFAGVDPKSRGRSHERFRSPTVTAGEPIAWVSSRSDPAVRAQKSWMGWRPLSTAKPDQQARLRILLRARALFGGATSGRPLDDLRHAERASSDAVASR